MAGKGQPKAPTLLELSTAVEYLPKEKLESILDAHKEHILEYAYILHDRDIYTPEEESENPAHVAGTTKYKHWHIAMRFNRGRRLSDVASWFGLGENFFSFSKTGHFDDMLLYITHANAKDKFQYEPEAVISNFDYSEWLTNFVSNAKKKLNDQRRNEIIQLIANGTIRQYNMYEFISPIEYDKYKSSINHALEYRAIILEQRNTRNMEVIYIYGKGGTGKSTYAETIAKVRGYSFKRSASERDPLATYKGQDAFALDDVRGSTFEFQDWQGILDNFQDRPGSSRFHDKHFTECKLLFITTTDSPEDFWKEMSGDRPREDPHQFYRRIKTVLHITDGDILCKRYNEKTHAFGKEYVMENNTYSKFDVHKETDEEQQEKLAHSLGIDKSKLKPTIKVEEPIGIIGKPIPFAKIHPTIPLEIAEKIKHDPLPYLDAHPEHKTLSLSQF